MEFCVSINSGEDKGGWASAHAQLYDNSNPAAYSEEEAIILNAAVNSQNGLDLRGLVTSADNVLQSFCNVGDTIGEKFAVSWYVGRLPVNYGDIVFTVKEHPIEDGVARRDDKLQALWRAKTPCHTGHALDGLPFSYPRGIIEVGVACESSGLKLAIGMDHRSTSCEQLALFFVYRKP